MSDDTLRAEALGILRDLSGAALARAVERLRGDAATPDAQHADQGPASFDPDGTSYTADELGDLLDARVEAMRRGEGVLTFEEFKARRASRWT